MTLRLLLVGDVHDRVDRLQQLVSELADDPKESIDVVLLDGDLANVPKPDSTRPEDSSPWLPGISEQLSMLDEFMLRVHKRSGSVYYIPGNHDPPQLFDTAATEHATERHPDLKRGRNLHAAAVRLAPSLCVCGTLSCVSTQRSQ
jgi:Icc-related predicted phosphoesterase